MIRQNQWKLIDNLKRKLYIKYELKRIILKSFILIKNNSLIYKTYWQYKISILPKLGLYTQHNKKCLKSGRNYSIYKFFKLSRFFLRTSLIKGLFPGVKRLNW